MPKKPEIIEKKTIASTRLFTIEQRKLVFANGVERDYERLVNRGSGAVMVVPLLDAETLLLIREYAGGIHDYNLGFPTGLINVNEDVLATANREIKEEIGYGAKSLTHLKQISSVPGYLSNQLYIVLATDLYEEKLPGDEPEELEVVPWKLNRLNELLKQDEFCDARSIAALMLLQDYSEKRL